MSAAESQDSEQCVGASSPTTHVKSAEALLEHAARLKTEGNAFYKEKNLRSAIGRYHRALLVLRSLDPNVLASVKGFTPDRPVLESEHETLLRNIQVDCYNNLAACLLQKQDVDHVRVQEYSLRVLQWRPDDAKALYRAGVATLEVGDSQAAKQYLLRASMVQPNDAKVLMHLRKVEEKINHELQKEKAMYRSMFSS
ncbi:tetratricopeptide repeat protein 9C [Neosynchiropus ocellatus]